MCACIEADRLLCADLLRHCASVGECAKFSGRFSVIAASSGKLEPVSEMPQCTAAAWCVCVFVKGRGGLAANAHLHRCNAIIYAFAGN
jgi:hypothetical protein